jgi:hypothetical protein
MALRQTFEKARKPGRIWGCHLWRDRKWVFWLFSQGAQGVRTPCRLMCRAAQTQSLDVLPFSRKQTVRARAANSCPSTNGSFAQSLRLAQILILEILQCIPVVKIFAFLDLERN